MEYTTITMKVPLGYEDQIRKLVLEKVGGILSYEITKPTSTKQAELAAEIDNSKAINGVLVK
jgi:plasmid maintenance system antidote protein VapI